MGESKRPAIEAIFLTCFIVVSIFIILTVVLHQSYRLSSHDLLDQLAVAGPRLSWLMCRHDFRVHVHNLNGEMIEICACDLT